jgi:hypothetical protein
MLYPRGMVFRRGAFATCLTSNSGSHPLHPIRSSTHGQVLSNRMSCGLAMPSPGPHDAKRIRDSSQARRQRVD